MNQKICIAVLFVAVCLCFTSAIPTYGGIGGLSFGLGQQYPRGYGGYGGIGVNPYAGAYGGVGSVEPIYSNGFGSEYGSRYGSYSPYYNRLGSGFGGGIGSGLGGSYGGGFQY